MLLASPAFAERSAWWRLHARWQLPLSSRLFAAPGGFAPIPAPSLPVGNAPSFAAEDYSTKTLYVANANDNTVSVVNVAECSSGDISGCARTSPTISVGNLPLGVAVDQATDTVYVANAIDDTVSVINGASCNATSSAGCDQIPVTVAVGAFDNAVAVDPVTNAVFDDRPGRQPGNGLSNRRKLLQRSPSVRLREPTHSHGAGGWRTQRTRRKPRDQHRLRGEHRSGQQQQQCA